jgi:hypothetical protein
MRWLLNRLGTRVGTVIGLVLLIAMAITIGRLAGETETLPTRRNEPIPLVTVSPTAGDDGVVDLTPSAQPSDETPVLVAIQFANAWLRTHLAADEWHAGVAHHATDFLAADLKGVDPRTVPANQRTGEPQVVLRDEAYLRIAVPMDTGTLVLKVFRDEGEWLVGEVDWEPS